MEAQPQALQPLLDAPGYGALRLAIGRLLHWHYRLFQQQRHRGFVLEQIDGLPLLVAPGVLNPRLMRTGEFFARQLARLLRADLLPPDAQVLDMGTGSGVCALFAARAARRIVAVDINPQAVRCTRINTLLHRCEDRIEVLHGDLFAPLSGRRFDAVLFNPPFLHGEPHNDGDRAWRSTDVAQRFASDLRYHLTPSGFALVLLSNYGGAREFISQFHRHGFATSVVAEREFVNERLAIVRLD
jgi:release factor glutamine methyltransferase